MIESNDRWLEVADKVGVFVWFGNLGTPELGLAILLVMTEFGVVVVKGERLLVGVKAWGGLFARKFAA